MKRAKSRQAVLRFKPHGGKRKRAGRKPVGFRREGPAHRARERKLSGREPAHVTLRTVGGLVNLRAKAVFEAVKGLLRAAQERFGYRVIQFSLQRNHLHLIVEAADWVSLSRGSKGLAVRLARMINARMGRRGRVFAHRYDAHVLRRPLEVRNALVYVLNNAKKHAREAGIAVPRGWLDPFSSAPTFDGWADRRDVPMGSADPPAVLAASVWLLTTGWKRHGELSLSEMPRS